MNKQPNDSKSRVGLWLLGAYGNVATVVATGLAALRQELAGLEGLTTELPTFRSLGLLDLGEFVVGGHEVRQGSFAASARSLCQDSGILSRELIDQTDSQLTAWSENVRPGVARGCGELVRSDTDWLASDSGSAVDLVSTLAADIRSFTERHNLRHTVVVNLCSVEPLCDAAIAPHTARELSDSLAKADCPLPASSLYALAAIDAGASYVNFTPSLGLAGAAMQERACKARISFMGRDGKTGETLVKSVVAPMLRNRHLRIRSWVGHNILGNRDGQVLSEPSARSSKIATKAEMLNQVLGYATDSIVTIEHVASLGDWKTAWDHIHFDGFLGTRMTLQFTWQGADSILAAPLVIDLARWADLAQRRGEHGCMSHLACYFKAPMQVTEHEFLRQWRALEEYSEQAKS